MRDRFVNQRLKCIDKWFQSGFFFSLAEGVALSRMKHLQAETGAHAARSSLYCSCKVFNFR